ncbi:MAG: ribosome recycling factor [Balneolales bacterium]
MLPELNAHYNHAKAEMNDAIDFLKRELSHIRAGKATPSLLDGVKVEYYGAQVPLNQLANVTAPEARMLIVEPFDKSTIASIEKTIMTSGLGLNPQNDGAIIRIPLPILSEERRKELVKVARDKAEQARVSIRNARRDGNDLVKKTVKADSLPEDSRFEAEDEIQKLTDSFNKTIEEFLESKEKEILTV